MADDVPLAAVISDGIKGTIMLLLLFLITTQFAHHWTGISVKPMHRFVHWNGIAGITVTFFSFIGHREPVTLPVLFVAFCYGISNAILFVIGFYITYVVFRSEYMAYNNTIGELPSKFYNVYLAVGIIFIIVSIISIIGALSTDQMSWFSLRMAAVAVCTSITAVHFEISMVRLYIKAYSVMAKHWIDTTDLVPPSPRVDTRKGLERKDNLLRTLDSGFEKKARKDSSEAVFKTKNKSPSNFRGINSELGQPSPVGDKEQTSKQQNGTEKESKGSISSSRGSMEKMLRDTTKTRGKRDARISNVRESVSTDNTVPNRPPPSAPSSPTLSVETPNPNSRDVSSSMRNPTRALISTPTSDAKSKIVSPNASPTFGSGMNARLSRPAIPPLSLSNSPPLGNTRKTFQLSKNGNQNPLSPRASRMMETGQVSPRYMGSRGMSPLRRTISNGSMFITRSNTRDVLYMRQLKQLKKRRKDQRMLRKIKITVVIVGILGLFAVIASTFLSIQWATSGMKVSEYYSSTTYNPIADFLTYVTSLMYAFYVYYSWIKWPPGFKWCRIFSITHLIEEDIEKSAMALSRHVSSRRHSHQVTQLQ